MIDRLASVSAVVNDILLRFSAFIILMMAALVFLGVASRNLAGYPLVWIDELISSMLPLVTLLISSALIDSRQHVAIEFLPKKATGATRTLLEAAFWVGCLVVSMAITYSGHSAVLYLYEHSIRSPSLLGIPDWVLQLSIPVGGAFMTFSSVVGFLEFMRGKSSS